ncbi:MAG: hypothetical protein MUP66_00795 [Candidatus Nanohaloarchaeota archaeon QJJ-5]|nr:hypothetical protein [Candidatus Nanohaloarchaeota archaeon QJJ-5]
MSTAGRSGGGMDPAYDWEAEYNTADRDVDEARAMAVDDIWSMDDTDLKLAAGALYTHPDSELDEVYDGPEEVYEQLQTWRETDLAAMEAVDPDGDLASYDEPEVLEDDDGNTVLSDGDNRLTFEEPLSGLHSVYDGDSDMFLDEA